LYIVQYRGNSNHEGNMKECFGRVIVVAQADSHLKWCINLASH